MVKLVDYSSRFEFLRQAAFALVPDVGVHALTLRALAAELGLGVNTVRRLVDPSTDLAVLAADEVRTRRRQGRLGRLPEEPDEAARALMRRVLPDDETRIDEEVVWLRLLAARGTRPHETDLRARVRHDFQVAERGWSDRDLDRDMDQGLDLALEGGPVPGPIRDSGQSGSQAMGSPAMGRHLEDRRHEIEQVCGRVLGLLEVADEEREAESGRLRALVDGLTIEVCLGRISPAECGRSMDRHLTGLRPLPARVAG